MSRVWLLLHKDLRVLRRSPLLLGVLIVYPLVVAGLVGLVAAYGSSKPRVALVDEDHLPRVARVGGESSRIQDAIDQVGKNIHLVRMDPDEARRALATGRVVATLTVPPGFLADLKSGRHHIVLDERLPRLDTDRPEEGAGHRAADDQRVDLGQQLLDDVDLAGDLRAAEDGDERLFRIL